MGTRPPDIAGLAEWRPIARGGFAMVWRARQTTLNRLVAVKVDDRQLDSASERRRFLREAGAAGRMSGHPGIVTVHDAGILPDDRPYLVMELCPSGSLNTWVKREGRPAETAVVDVGVRIAGALAAAHAIGVIHRDVKPANILIDAYGHAGLADFGLAALPEPDAPIAEAMEALTPAYAPPEVLAGEPATAAGDVYALAATLYALLAGHSPHWAEQGVPTPAQIAAKRGEPVARISDVTPELMDALMAGLADNPAERPTAAELRDRLAAAGRSSSSAEIVVSPVSAGTGRPWAVALAVGIIVLGVVAAALVATFGPDSTAVAPPATTTPPVAGSPTAGTGPAGSPTSGPTATPTPVPSPTPSPLPAGFVDCTERAGIDRTGTDRTGAAAVCPVAAECWAGVFSYMDSPYQATPQTCSKPHVYQTFAAVQLDYTPRRESQIEQDASVRAACNRRVLNRLLVGVQADATWEVIVIPPQFSDDAVYRCIAGQGTRTGALDLTGG